VCPDPDAHSFLKLDPDPHSLKNLDPDLQTVNADPKTLSSPTEGFKGPKKEQILITD
jgi:hypothetical protein